MLLCIYVCMYIQCMYVQSIIWYIYIYEDSSVSERLEHLKEHLREKEKEIRHRETQNKKKRELLEQKEKQSENLKVLYNVQ